MCRLLAGEIDNSKDRMAFLAACEALSVDRTAQSEPSSRPSLPANPAPAPDRTVQWEASLIKRIGAELACYVGPVASVLVARAMKRAQTPEQLYEILSSEIASEQDRRKFLSVRR
jgi:hypothetical protein